MFRLTFYRKLYATLVKFPVISNCEHVYTHYPQNQPMLPTKVIHTQSAFILSFTQLFHNIVDNSFYFNNKEALAFKSRPARFPFQ